MEKAENRFKLWEDQSCGCLKRKVLINNLIESSWRFKKTVALTQPDIYTSRLYM